MGDVSCLDTVTHSLLQDKMRSSGFSKSEFLKGPVLVPGVLPAGGFIGGKVDANAIY